MNHSAASRWISAKIKATDPIAIGFTDNTDLEISVICVICGKEIKSKLSFEQLT